MLNLRYNFGFIGRLFGVPRKFISQVGAFCASFTSGHQIIDVRVPAFPAPRTAPVSVGINEESLAKFINEKSDISSCVKKSDIGVAGGVAAHSHTHTKSQITDFSHTHTKSQITDFSHTHTKSQITNFTHTHSLSEISNFPSGSTSTITVVTDVDWNGTQLVVSKSTISLSSGIVTGIKAATGRDIGTVTYNP